MAYAQLRNGRFRATIKHPVTGKRVSAADVLREPGVTSYRTKTEARAACDQALTLLREQAAAAKAPTLLAFWERWTTDPLFARKKESTNLHNRERTHRFVKEYGHLRLDQIGDDVAAAWIEGAKNLGTVKVLCTMFNDAASRKAGRLIATNPFAGLGLGKGEGRANQQPPTEPEVWGMIGAARRLASPSFAGWLQVACFTGMRPAEIDALKWEHIDFAAGWIHVREQYSVKSRSFTLPKNGQIRKVILTREAREAFMAQPRDAAYCFTNLRGEHWTHSARHYHWNAVCAAVGWEGDLYLATRHFAGWLMYEVMQLDAADVGYALGHTGRDVGRLVRETYGHRSAEAGLQRVREALEDRAGAGGLRAA